MIHMSRARAVPALAALWLMIVGCGLALPIDGRSPDDAAAAWYPTEGRPVRIAINHDGFEAKHVGHAADGGQFFLTIPFDGGTADGDDAREFVALYLFDAEGHFREAEIDAFPAKGLGRTDAAKKVYRQRLKELGEVTFDRIEVEPFAVEKYGLTFGLVAQAPASSDEIWWVTAEPGNYMAFAAPWDSGEYDT